MTTTVQTLTEDQWIAIYQPETNAQGELYVQRDWYTPADRDLIQQAESERRLWTMVDCDDKLWIMAGAHRVNHLYYIITAVPYPEGTHIDVNCD